MAVRLSTWLLTQGINGFDYRNSKPRIPFSSSSSRILPASCKMRQRNLSSLHKKQPLKKPSRESLSDGNIEPDSELVLTSSSQILNKGIVSKDNVPNSIASEDLESKGLGSLIESEETNTLANAMSVTEKISGFDLDDLIRMIRHAEKNILLLNQARVRALDELQKILSEKEELRGEIKALQMRLAETDARLKVAYQEKIHVELLEGQIEELRNELLTSKSSSGVVNQNGPLEKSDEISSPPVENTAASFSPEVDSIRSENLSLKNDVEKLKEELSFVKSSNNERVIMLEKERASLESTVKDLESKLSTALEEVSKLSTLKIEYESLMEKVKDLKTLLDKATIQADQAIVVLQQNQDLRKKVEKLEESLEEARSYKVSSEKLQRYNDLMKQKIKMLEDRIQKSDEEIHTYVQSYQESVQEFQVTLYNLKEENKKRALDEPVEDMPWEFWSRLLLMIDGWLIEKKIPSDDAKLLREMTWKRDRRVYNAYMECKEKNEHDALATFLRLTSAPKSSGLHIIHIAAEMAPVAKVGGLGDVVTGLSKSLQKKGHLIEIVLPKYDCMQDNIIRDLRVLDTTLESYFDGRLHKNKVWLGTVEGLPVYFIEPLHHEKFFHRGQIYGEHDDFRRFSYFSRAALELLLQAGKKPDIIHCHDWQTSFVGPLYWDLYVPKGLNSARICFTCHNFEYQGNAPAWQLAACGLDADQLNRPDRMQDHPGRDRVNPVKGAVVFSNIVTTVSPTYAKEVRTAEGGKGLHSELNLYSKKFVGILNGIDTEAWNPATDKFLKVQYSVNDLHGKAENKEALRRMLGLSSPAFRKPLVAVITRLVPQKGVHLIRHAIYRTLELGGQFVLLGSSPVQHIQKEFEGIANQFQNHEDIRLMLKYDESLSHSIYAASDMFIIPSIFEPCGLTQMISMRYGSIPIVRKTGGLHDSVFDVDDNSIPLQFRNGFTFLTPDEKGVNSALDRAIDRYNKNPENWEKLVHKVMSIDFSWDSSASQYEELYSKAVARARAARS